MLNEFEIIQRYFNHPTHSDIIQGIGDDAAIWQQGNATLVASVDTLLEGRHFFPNCAPEDVAYKALAVNLSDFAAMGATPRWFTLALTLPKADTVWLEKFSHSLLTLAKQYHVDLIGGDTTKGPLSITIQVMGTVDKDKALLRSGAKIGDDIYVSGTIGDAGLALQYLQKKIALSADIAAILVAKLNRPEPQVALGLALAGHAHAAIDISDGLAQDLGHILQQSGVGAQIHLEQLPLSHHLVQSLTREKAEELALCAGDDYQLCFTVAPDSNVISELSTQYSLTCIGNITAGGLQIFRKGELFTKEWSGWQHF